MKRRKLGNSKLELSPLALGGNVFGWTIDERTSFGILDKFLDSGHNFIDTADVYSTWAPGNKGGESETILGKWLKLSGKRDKVLIATKVGMEMGPGKKGLSKKYILSAIEDSLKRLQTDYVDLYQSHKDDPNTPMEETLDAYSELIRQGKVRAIGASNYTSERLAEGLKLSREKGCPRFESLQPLYNLYDREDYEKNLEPLCIKEKVGVISFFSLGAGFLTGKYRSEKDLEGRARGARVQKYLNDRGFRILKALDQVAEQAHSTPGRVAIAWLLSRPSVTAPIASATNLTQLDDLIEATRLELSSSSLQLLNLASA